MKNIATIAQQSLDQVQERPHREPSPTTRKLFMLMHGAYGNPFLAKFNTGQLVKEGPNKDKDKGMLTAMLVWDTQLSRYPGDVVELAVHRAFADNPEFAPSLPKLVNLCEALMPRKTHAELAGFAQLPAPTLVRVKVSIEPVGDGKDWARKIKARADAGDKTVTYGVLKSALQALRELP